jgi:hypothetical protein
MPRPAGQTGGATNRPASASLNCRAAMSSLMGFAVPLPTIIIWLTTWLTEKGF